MIRLRTLGAVDLKDSEGCELRPLLTQPKRLALLTYEMPEIILTHR